MTENNKVLLVHHGGHRGGYGVCWDLRTSNQMWNFRRVSGTYAMTNFGLVSTERFKALSEGSAEDGWHDGLLQIHFPDKKSAIEAAKKMGLEIMTPQTLAKLVEEKHKSEECNSKYCWLHEHIRQHKVN